ncbi:porin family protein [Pedobacter sp. UC225_65]|uniref:porin family protein n=1 Tax=Pedobacter sp. UC225_65 TaxID=3350173 RepID=UPI00366A907A
MKKLLLSLTLVVGLGLATHAQTKNPLQIGLKAGVNFANASVSNDNFYTSFKANTTFYFGGTIDFAIGEMLSLQPGLTLIGKGTKLTATDEDETFTTKLNTMNLEVPVNLLVNLKAGDGKVFLGGGPYYSVALSGKLKHSDEEDEDVKFGSDDQSDLRRGDFGLNFLLGYRLNNGFNIHGGYSVGLKDVSAGNMEDVKIKNKAFSVGIGFSF